MKVSFKLQRVYNTYTHKKVWDVHVYENGVDNGKGRYCPTLADSLRYIWWYKSIKKEESV